MKLINPKLYNERVGYYEVAGARYDNKWDAMLHATSLNCNYTWDFAPEIFSKFDWTKPIHYSLDDLYRIRLQQLRDYYDHLILFFSGGKDSLNILMTALNNNILLDEIVVYYPFAMEKYFNNTDLDSDNLYSEVKYAAKPMLKKLQMENKLDKRTKIRFQDIGDTTNEFTKKDDWFDQIRPANTVQMVSPSNGGACDPELIKLALQGKNTAVITGADKPRIIEMNNGFYFTFADIAFNSIPRPKSKEMKSQYEFINYEAFYQTPFLPELVIKQAQVIAAAYNVDEKLRNLKVTQNDENLNLIVSEKERILSTYLYSDGIQPWQTLKHKKHLYRRGEKVVWQTMNRDVKDNYLNGVHSIVKQISRRFFVNGDYIQGPTPCISKPYFIQHATYGEIIK